MSCTTCSISSTIAESALAGTGRFSQARCNPTMSFCRSNGSRRPSFFTTKYGISSTRSYDVNRRPQDRHSRRRRIASPALVSRESTTLSLRWAQNGQIIPRLR